MEKKIELTEEAPRARVAAAMIALENIFEVLVIELMFELKR